MGLLDDRVLSNRDGLEWGFRALSAAGYDVQWSLLPDSRHAMLTDRQWALSDESWELVVDAVVHAERN